MRAISLSLAIASALLLTASGSCNDGSQARMPGRIKTVPTLPCPARLPPPPAALPQARSGEFALIGELTQGGWISGLAPLDAREDLVGFREGLLVGRAGDRDLLAFRQRELERLGQADRTSQGGVGRGRRRKGEEQDRY